MSSNYNSRLKPDEVLITENDSDSNKTNDILIRRREKYEDLLIGQNIKI